MNDTHLLNVGDDTFFIQHSMRCRLSGDLAAGTCAVHNAVVDKLKHRDIPAGRWRADKTSGGEVTLTQVPDDWQPESEGAELIAKERQRQLEELGFTAEHDDDHEHGELRHAAIAFITGDENWWPWLERSGGEWNPGDELDDLVKAGALIAAEVDRLLRNRVGDT